MIDDGRVDGWMNERLDGCMNRWADRWMDRLMDGRLDGGWIKGRVDEWVSG